MNPRYREVIAAGDEEHRNLFLTAASRMWTAAEALDLGTVQARMADIE